MVLKRFALIMLAAVMLASQALASDEIIVRLRGDLEPPPDITANAAVIVNLQTGEVIFEKNAGRIIYPGPAVKLMTAIVAIEHIEDPGNDISMDTRSVTSAYVASRVVAGTIGFNIAMREGEVFTVEQLLYAIMVRNANDACLAIAELISGSVPAFVAKMNARARELGAENTIFTNPTGLHDPGMHTTALDIARIAKHASGMPLIMQISSVPFFEIPPTNMTASTRSLLNRNHLVSNADTSRYFYEHARGMNAGSTLESGFCLITVGQQHPELAYLCVVMGATLTHSPALGVDIINSFLDARKLLDWAFTIYAYRTIVRRRQQITTVRIELAAARDEVTLVTEDYIRLLIPRGTDISEESDEIEWMVNVHEDRLFAPIEQGQVLGELTIMYLGAVAGRTSLVATADVEPSNILHALDQIRAIVSRPWFSASIIIFIALCAVYIAVNIIRKSRRERKRYF